MRTPETIKPVLEAYKDLTVLQFEEVNYLQQLQEEFIGLSCYWRRRNIVRKIQMRQLKDGIEARSKKMKLLDEAIYQFAQGRHQEEKMLSEVNQIIETHEIKTA